MQKASMGARIGALLLDGLFINIIASFLAFISFNLYAIFVVFGTFLYYGICEGSSMSATLGKKICGIIVLDENGNKLSSSQGFLRSLCRILSGIILGIGYLLALFDDENRALHDKLAKTFVAKEIPVAQQQMPIAQQMQTPNPTPVQRSVPMGVNPQIIGVAGQFAGKSFQISQQGILMGRDSASCEFAFPDNAQGISRNHCRIMYNPQTQMFVLYDLGSSYGTFLATGAKVLQGQPVALRPGDEFYLASRANTFRVSL